MNRQKDRPLQNIETNEEFFVSTKPATGFMRKTEFGCFAKKKSERKILQNRKKVR